MAILASEALTQSAEGIFGLPGRIPVVLGIPPSRPGLPEKGMPFTYQERFLRWTRARLNGLADVLDIETVEEEQTASVLALREAMRKLDTGETDICIVGGADSWFSVETLDYLEDEGRLQTSYRPHGFVPGEGAGTFVLTREKGLKKYALSPVCAIGGIGTAMEPAPSFTRGKALSDSVTQALSNLDPSVKPAILFCDMNGERYRVDDLGYSVRSIVPRVKDGVSPETLTDLFGDAGAATGMFLINQAAFASRVDNEPHALVWMSSRSGMRAAILLNINPERS
jgi:3-oxoacyl-[acyl-carrier-protein] synthase-1